jgi:hypothetical protein
MIDSLALRSVRRDGIPAEKLSIGAEEARARPLIEWLRSI